MNTLLILTHSLRSVLPFTILCSVLLLLQTARAAEPGDPPQLSIQMDDSLSLSIQGGEPPFQIQFRNKLDRGLWSDLGLVITDRTMPITNKRTMKFYRVFSLAEWPVEDYFFEDFTSDNGNPLTWEYDHIGQEYAGGNKEITNEGWDWTPSGGNMAAQIQKISYKAASLHAKFRQKSDHQVRSNYTYLVFGGFFCGVHPNGTLRVWAGEVLWEESLDFDPLEQDVHVHLVVQGSNLSLAAWKDGAPYPDQPQIAMSIQPISGSRAGLFHNNGGTGRGVIWRFLEVRRLE